MSMAPSPSSYTKTSAPTQAPTPAPEPAPVLAPAPAPASSHSRPPIDISASSITAEAALRSPPPPLHQSADSSLQRRLSTRSLETTASELTPPAEFLSRPKHRQSTLSTSSRAGLFTLAALARDKTTSALASFSEPSVRSRPSSGSLYRIAQTSPASSTPASTNTSDHNNHTNGRDNSKTSQAVDHFQGNESSRLSPNSSRASSPRLRKPIPVSYNPRQSLLETNPPSQAYSDTSSNTPPPISFVPQGKPNSKMHQTSSRLLRMTSDERPYMRDFKDLFSTLVVSLPLALHRVRLTRVEHSFLSEEAINNLGSLKFSQSNRMPDPKDPSRIVTTTTTTTFSMAREMARSVCQRFLDARLVESADGKQAKEFTMKGSVWQLTPKGVHILERFCSRNGIQQRHVLDLINSPRNTMQLVIMERDSETDKLSSDKSTVEVVFRRFVGANGPNVKNSTSSADSDSLSEYKDGLSGVRMANERKVGSPPRTVYQTFTGKAASDWLMDCCTTVDKSETIEIATAFLEQELIWCVQSDRVFLQQYLDKERDPKLQFQPTKNAIYQLSQKGKDVVNMTNRERTSESEGSGNSAARVGVSRDSNTQKLDKILTDNALRLLFRENLRDTHCEENLSFYLDVDEFLKACKQAIKANSSARSGASKTQNLDAVKETMASAYGIYNAFLAPGSPCELNIDHLLRNQLATRMTKAVGQDAAMIESLKEVTKLFEDAQLSVFKLMASDSVPKFMKSAKYEQTLKNYDFDSLSSRNHGNGVPERSLSRSNGSNR